METDNVIPIGPPTRYEKIKMLALFIWSMDDKQKGHWNEFPYITMAGAIMESLDPTTTVIYNSSPKAKKMSKRLSKLSKKNI